MERDIFTRRGIKLDGPVFTARRYAEFQAGEVDAVYNHCPEMWDDTGRRNTGWTEKSVHTHGWIIPKFRAYPELPLIRPQLRPDEPVLGDEWTHNHDDNFVDGHGRRIKSEHARRDHLDSTKWWDDHHGASGRLIRKDATHTHQPEEKYRIAPRTAITFTQRINGYKGYELHGLDEEGREAWAHELRRREAELREVREERAEAARVKRATKGTKRHAKATKRHAELARQAQYLQRDLEGTRFEIDDSVRLDVHPLADWTQPGPAFFGIEGAIKAGAMLEWLLDNGWPPKVVDVPGVAMWNAPELARFALDYMQDGPVFIVPDADWATKPEVLYHALNCQRFLQYLCGVDAHVAAPPEGFGRTPDDKGVDDYLGEYEGALDKMQVLHFSLADFDDWQDEYKTWRNARRGTHDESTAFDISVAKVLAETAGPDGHAIRGVASISRLLRGHTFDYEEAVRRAQLAQAEPRPQRAYDHPWWSMAYEERRDFTDDQRRMVARALARLEEFGTFEATGDMVWMDRSWETTETGRRYQRQARWQENNGVGLELLNLEPRLHLRRGHPATVGKLLDLLASRAR